jgi:CheY-like chemotaxis protein
MKNKREIDLSNITILVVDDEPDNLTIVEHALQLYGADVVIAHNGAHAIEHLFSVQPDVFIIDLMMPYMSGFKLLEHIRRMHRFSHTPAIALTAGVVSTNRFTTLSAGFADYITKPFDFDELAQAIKNSLGKSAAV